MATEQTEIAALSESLRTLAKELWPLRKHHIDAMQFDDQILLLGVYLERKKIDKLPMRWLTGSSSGPTARPRKKV